METPTPTTCCTNIFQLCSLTEWSKRHIQAIFEARSDDESLHAISETFSDGVRANMNGLPLSRAEIDQLVLAMRRGSLEGLTVQWQDAIEASLDSSHRDGAFGGVYTIRGLGDEPPCPFNVVDHERHKIVIVKIESQSLSLHLDSRRIVDLSFVATDTMGVDR